MMERVSSQQSRVDENSQKLEVQSPIEITDSSAAGGESIVRDFSLDHHLKR